MLEIFCHLFIGNLIWPLKNFQLLTMKYIFFKILMSGVDTVRGFSSDGPIRRMPPSNRSSFCPKCQAIRIKYTCSATRTLATRYLLFLWTTLIPTKLQLSWCHAPTRKDRHVTTVACPWVSLSFPKTHPRTRKAYGILARLKKRFTTPPNMVLN